MNINDPAVLRKRIADLENENKRLKEGDSGMQTNKVGFNTMRSGPTNLAAPQQDKDWMNFGGGSAMGIERPTTASSNSQMKQLQEELKFEKKEKKYLADEIENLKKELQKSNFSAFTQTSSAISVTAGRLPQVPGVREITMDDIEIGE
jgi:hypothetical protein